LSMDERNAQWWSLQGEAFDALVQHKRESAPRAPIAAGCADEPGQTLRAVALHPPTQGAKRVRVLAGDVRQHGVRFEERPYYLKARHRFGAFVVGELGQRSDHLISLRAVSTQAHKESWTSDAREVVRRVYLTRVPPAAPWPP